MIRDEDIEIEQEGRPMARTLYRVVHIPTGVSVEQEGDRRQSIAWLRKMMERLSEKVDERQKEISRIKLPGDAYRTMNRIRAMAERIIHAENNKAINPTRSDLELLATECSELSLMLHQIINSPPIRTMRDVTHAQPSDAAGQAVGTGEDVGASAG